MEVLATRSGRLRAAPWIAFCSMERSSQYLPTELFCFSRTTCSMRAASEFPRAAAFSRLAARSAMPRAGPNLLAWPTKAPVACSCLLSCSCLLASHVSPKLCRVELNPPRARDRFARSWPGFGRSGGAKNLGAPPSIGAPTRWNVSTGVARGCNDGAVIEPWAKAPADASVGMPPRSWAAEARVTSP